MFSSLPIVATLIIVSNLIFSFKGFKNDIFFNKYRFEVKKIKEGDLYRLISSGFLHVNTTHLLFNMVTFYFFVNIVIYELGSTLFLMLYFVSLFVGNIFAYKFHYNQPDYIAVGASGAVTGVLFSSLLLYPEIELFIFFIPIPIPGYIFGIGYIIYTLYGMKTQNDNIGHTAHFGGAVGGIVMTILFDFGVVFSSQLMLGVLLIVILFAGLLLFRK